MLIAAAAAAVPVSGQGPLDPNSIVIKGSMLRLSACSAGRLPSWLSVAQVSVAACLELQSSTRTTCLGRGADSRPLPNAGQRRLSLPGRTVHIAVASERLFSLPASHVFTDQRHRLAAERAQIILSS